MTADQLRKSILQQAIQGKLVPQDPNDEPASVLLERIREEKARLVKEKKIKKEKNPSIIFRGEDNSHYEKFTLTGEVKCIDDEIPFDLPKGWEWTRLGEIFLHASGKQQSSTNNSGGNLREYITTSNVYWGYFDLNILKVMNFTDLEVESSSATKGDLLVCEGGAGYGRSAIWNKDYDICLQNHLHRLRPCVKGICEYVFYLLYLLKESNQLTSVGTAMPGLSANKLKNILVPAPPLAEQQRIVARIEELMPLVEQYGKAQGELEALDNNIREQLKKSVLQYAIEGKLVPQCEEDGTAEDLLLEIQAEKQRLYAKGKLKKKDLAHSTIFRGEDNKYYEQIGKEIFDITEEVPYDLPNSWSFCRLREICFIFTGATFRKEETIGEISGVRILRGGNILPRKLLYKPDDIFLPKDKIPNSILLRKNDIVTPAVTSLENIGKMVRIASHIQDTAVGGFVFTLRLYKDMDVLSIYLQSLLSTPLLIKFLRSISNKSGQAFYNIGKERLGLALLPIPALGEQQRITQAIENIFELIEGE
ncbi:type I restriction-modification system, specificity subunit S [Porphyromonas crevioricanis JCM 15906]|uniref:Type I restriction-modification system, specificity subunit S n=1 Tax=Porphyromonas crevioricanis JCM 15906 TaxID=1305617 RepID=T1DQU8_9PORP|nr:restriction endonuclease subunit S [Porphyromonas crevioricanis]GAD04965.1 type I restriction-modification system, specificity subunit S [Porphyromonas crevioricanis JCM 15906]SKA05596.1 type I restriction enzyme, S subunit [Porphyromonas crevioricanis]